MRRKRNSHRLNIGVGLVISMMVIFIAGATLTACGQADERITIDLEDRISDQELSGLAKQREPDVLRFGFDLRASPQEDARQYIPFLEYLAGATGYLFELRFSAKNGKIVEDLGSGKVQFAAVGCGTYLRARQEYNAIPLVRGLNAQGRAQYQSLIIVAPGSPIENVEDLRGKRFAFGGVTSTQGHLIPRIILEEHGLALEDLAYYEFTGSHRNCANEVISGRFHAGGLQDTMGRELAEAGLVRIIHASRFYPSSGIVANKDMDPEILSRVKRALVDFQPKGRDAAGLYHWERTEMPNGFREARDEDYAKLREWANKLGFQE